MQSAYALMIAESDKLDTQERYLISSMERLHQLYILQLQLMVAVLDLAKQRFETSKHNFIPTDSIKTTSPNFINNKVLQQLANSPELKRFAEDKKVTKWADHIEIIELIWQKIQDSNIFETYAEIESPTYKDDKKFILSIYKKVIAPNDQLYEFYEDEVISWADDIPFVNTWILNNIVALKNTSVFNPDVLYKDPKDKDFALQLFRKTVLNYTKYEEDINESTPNWDSERITKIDKLLMIMAITEFFHFPSIPTKVSINEYIEIAKDYATQKSSFFINGVLDKLLSDYNKKGIIQKIGRGLR
jgi:N utilization substance protein B